MPADTRSRATTLGDVVKMLRKHYGAIDGPPTSDPFELILWENVAYLASPARRREAFDALRRSIGTTSSKLLAAKQAALERVTAHGILKETFAAKLRECAVILEREFHGDLHPTMAGPVEAAKKALGRFPGIGGPAAERILLFAGRQPLLAPESNGLRVLVRLGFVREEKSYAKTYAASRAIAATLQPRVGVMQKAHLLLQEHGRMLCTRKTPSCGVCPLADRCDWIRRHPELLANPG